jgi:hypothetical protein
MICCYLFCRFIPILLHLYNFIHMIYLYTIVTIWYSLCNCNLITLLSHDMIYVIIMFGILCSIVIMWYVIIHIIHMMYCHDLQSYGLVYSMNTCDISRKNALKVINWCYEQYGYSKYTNELIMLKFHKRHHKVKLILWRKGISTAKNKRQVHKDWNRWERFRRYSKRKQ